MSLADQSLLKVYSSRHFLDTSSQGRQLFSNDDEAFDYDKSVLLCDEWDDGEHYGEAAHYNNQCNGSHQDTSLGDHRKCKRDISQDDISLQALRSGTRVSQNDAFRGDLHRNLQSGTRDISQHDSSLWDLRKNLQSGKMDIFQHDDRNVPSDRFVHVDVYPCNNHSRNSHCSRSIRSLDAVHAHDDDVYASCASSYDVFYYYVHVHVLLLY